MKCYRFRDWKVKGERGIICLPEAVKHDKREMREQGTADELH